eukprot:747640-Hanusia_phi.AAC.1
MQCSRSYLSPLVVTCRMLRRIASNNSASVRLRKIISPLVYEGYQFNVYLEDANRFVLAAFSKTFDIFAGFLLEYQLFFKSFPYSGYSTELDISFYAKFPALGSVRVSLPRSMSFDTMSNNAVFSVSNCVDRLIWTSSTRYSVSFYWNLNAACNGQAQINVNVSLDSTSNQTQILTSILEGNTPNGSLLEESAAVATYYGRSVNISEIQVQQKAGSCSVPAQCFLLVQIFNSTSRTFVVNLKYLNYTSSVPLIVCPRNSWCNASGTGNFGIDFGEETVDTSTSPLQFQYPDFNQSSATSTNLNHILVASSSLNTISNQSTSSSKAVTLCLYRQQEFAGCSSTTMEGTSPRPVITNILQDGVGRVRISFTLDYTFTYLSLEILVLAYSGHQRNETYSCCDIGLKGCCRLSNLQMGNLTSGSHRFILIANGLAGASPASKNFTYNVIGLPPKPQNFKYAYVQGSFGFNLSWDRIPTHCQEFSNYQLTINSFVIILPLNATYYVVKEIGNVTIQPITVYQISLSVSLSTLNFYVSSRDKESIRASLEVKTLSDLNSLYILKSCPSGPLSIVVELWSVQNTTEVTAEVYGFNESDPATLCCARKTCSSTNDNICNHSCSSLLAMDLQQSVENFTLTKYADAMIWRFHNLSRGFLYTIFFAAKSLVSSARSNVTVQAIDGNIPAISQVWYNLPNVSGSLVLNISWKVSIYPVDFDTEILQNSDASFHLPIIPQQNSSYTDTEGEQFIRTYNASDVDYVQIHGNDFMVYSNSFQTSMFLLEIVDQKLWESSHIYIYNKSAGKFGGGCPFGQSCSLFLSSSCANCSSANQTTKSTGAYQVLNTFGAIKSKFLSFDQQTFLAIVNSRVPKKYYCSQRSGTGTYGLPCADIVASVLADCRQGCPQECICMPSLNGSLSPGQAGRAPDVTLYQYNSISSLFEYHSVVNEFADILSRPSAVDFFDVQNCSNENTTCTANSDNCTCTNITFLVVTDYIQNSTVYAWNSTLKRFTRYQTLEVVGALTSTHANTENGTFLFLLHHGNVNYTIESPIYKFNGNEFIAISSFASYKASGIVHVSIGSSEYIVVSNGGLSPADGKKCAEVQCSGYDCICDIKSSICSLDACPKMYRLENDSVSHFQTLPVSDATSVEAFGVRDSAFERVGIYLIFSTSWNKHQDAIYSQIFIWSFTSLQFSSWTPFYSGQVSRWRIFEMDQAVFFASAVRKLSQSNLSTPPYGFCMSGNSPFCETCAPFTSPLAAEVLSYSALSPILKVASWPSYQLVSILNTSLSRAVYTGIVIGSEYSLQLRGVNLLGKGPLSFPVIFSAKKTPRAQWLKTTYYSTFEFQLNWLPPPYDPVISILEYRLQMFLNCAYYSEQSTVKCPVGVNYTGCCQLGSTYYLGNVTTYHLFLYNVNFHQNVDLYLFPVFQSTNFPYTQSGDVSKSSIFTITQPSSVINLELGSAYGQNRIFSGWQPPMDFGIGQQDPRKFSHLYDLIFLYNLTILGEDGTEYIQCVTLDGTRCDCGQYQTCFDTSKPLSDVRLISPPDQGILNSQVKYIVNVSLKVFNFNGRLLYNTPVSEGSVCADEFPLPPFSLSVSNDGIDSISATWKANMDAPCARNVVSNFLLQISEQPYFYPIYTNFSNQSSRVCHNGQVIGINISWQERSWESLGFVDGHRYFFRIFAQNPSGTSLPSNTISIIKNNTLPIAVFDFPGTQVNFPESVFLRFNVCFPQNFSVPYFHVKACPIDTCLEPLYLRVWAQPNCSEYRVVYPNLVKGRFYRFDVVGPYHRPGDVYSKPIYERSVGLPGPIDLNEVSVFSPSGQSGTLQLIWYPPADTGLGIGTEFLLENYSVSIYTSLDKPPNRTIVVRAHLSTNMVWNGNTSYQFTAQGLTHPKLQKYFRIPANISEMNNSSSNMPRSSYGNQTNMLNKNVLKLLVRELLPGQTYFFTISASNYLGYGPSVGTKGEIFARPKFSPPALSKFFVTGIDLSFSFTWNLEYIQGNYRYLETVQGYTLQVEDGNATTNYPISNRSFGYGLSFPQDNLTRRYCFVMFAYNEAGQSPASEEVCFNSRDAWFPTFNVSKICNLSGCFIYWPDLQNEQNGTIYGVELEYCRKPFSWNAYNKVTWCAKEFIAKSSCYLSDCTTFLTGITPGASYPVRYRFWKSFQSLGIDKQSSEWIVDTFFYHSLSLGSVVYSKVTLQKDSKYAVPYLKLLVIVKNFHFSLKSCFLKLISKTNSSNTIILNSSCVSLQGQAFHWGLSTVNSRLLLNRTYMDSEYLGFVGEYSNGSVATVHDHLVFPFEFEYPLTYVSSVEPSQGLHDGFRVLIMIKGPIEWKSSYDIYSATEPGSSYNMSLNASSRGYATFLFTSPQLTVACERGSLLKSFRIKDLDLEFSLKYHSSCSMFISNFEPRQLQIYKHTLANFSLINYNWTFSTLDDCNATFVHSSYAWKSFTNISFNMVVANCCGKALNWTRSEISVMCELPPFKTFYSKVQLAVDGVILGNIPSVGQVVVSRPYLSSSDGEFAYFSRYQFTPDYRNKTTEPIRINATLNYIIIQIQGIGADYAEPSDFNVAFDCPDLGYTINATNISIIFQTSSQIRFSGMADFTRTKPCLYTFLVSIYGGVVTSLFGSVLVSGSSLQPPQKKNCTPAMVLAILPSSLKCNHLENVTIFLENFPEIYNLTDVQISIGNETMKFWWMQKSQGIATITVSVQTVFCGYQTIQISMISTSCNFSTFDTLLLEDPTVENALMVEPFFVYENELSKVTLKFGYSINSQTMSQFHVLIGSVQVQNCSVLVNASEVTTLCSIPGLIGGFDVSYTILVVSEYGWTYIGTLKVFKNPPSQCNINSLLNLGNLTYYVLISDFPVVSNPFSFGATIRESEGRTFFPWIDQASFVSNPYGTSFLFKTGIDSKHSYELVFNVLYNRYNNSFYCNASLSIDIPFLHVSTAIRNLSCSSDETILVVKNMPPVPSLYEVLILDTSRNVFMPNNLWQDVYDSSLTYLHFLQGLGSSSTYQLQINGSNLNTASFRLMSQPTHCTVYDAPEPYLKLNQVLPSIGPTSGGYLVNFMFQSFVPKQNIIPRVWFGTVEADVVNTSLQISGNYLVSVISPPSGSVGMIDLNIFVQSSSSQLVRTSYIYNEPIKMHVMAVVPSHGRTNDHLIVKVYLQNIVGSSIENYSIFLDGHFQAIRNITVISVDRAMLTCEFSLMNSKLQVGKISFYDGSILSSTEFYFLVDPGSYIRQISPSTSISYSWTKVSAFVENFPWSTFRASSLMALVGDTFVYIEKSVNISENQTQFDILTPPIMCKFELCKTTLSIVSKEYPDISIVSSDHFYQSTVPFVVETLPKTLYSTMSGGSFFVTLRNFHYINNVAEVMVWSMNHVFTLSEIFYSDHYTTTLKLELSFSNLTSEIEELFILHKLVPGMIVKFPVHIYAPIPKIVSYYPKDIWKDQRGSIVLLIENYPHTALYVMKNFAYERVYSPVTPRITAGSLTIPNYDLYEMKSGFNNTVQLSFKVTFNSLGQKAIEISYYQNPLARIVAFDIHVRSLSEILFKSSDAFPVFSCCSTLLLDVANSVDGLPLASAAILNNNYAPLSTLKNYGSYSTVQISLPIVSTTGSHVLTILTFSKTSYAAKELSLVFFQGCDLRSFCERWNMVVGMNAKSLVEPLNECEISFCDIPTNVPQLNLLSVQKKYGVVQEVLDNKIVVQNLLYFTKDDIRVSCDNIYIPVVDISELLDQRTVLDLKFPSFPVSQILECIIFSQIDQRRSASFSVTFLPLEDLNKATLFPSPCIAYAYTNFTVYIEHWMLFVPDKEILVSDGKDTRAVANWFDYGTMITFEFQWYCHNTTISIFQNGSQPQHILVNLQAVEPYLVSTFPSVGPANTETVVYVTLAFQSAWKPAIHVHDFCNATHFNLSDIFVAQTGIYLQISFTMPKITISDGMLSNSYIIHIDFQQENANFETQFSVQDINQIPIYYTMSDTRGREEILLYMNGPHDLLEERLVYIVGNQNQSILDFKPMGSQYFLRLPLVQYTQLEEPIPVQLYDSGQALNLAFFLYQEKSPGQLTVIPSSVSTNRAFTVTLNVSSLFYISNRTGTLNILLGNQTAMDWKVHMSDHYYSVLYVNFPPLSFASSTFVTIQDLLTQQSWSTEFLVVNAPQVTDVVPSRGPASGFQLTLTGKYFPELHDARNLKVVCSSNSGSVENVFWSTIWFTAILNTPHLTGNLMQTCSLSLHNAQIAHFYLNVYPNPTAQLKFDRFVSSNNTLSIDLEVGNIPNNSANDVLESQILSSDMILIGGAKILSRDLETLLIKIPPLSPGNYVLLLKQSSASNLLHFVVPDPSSPSIKRVNQDVGYSFNLTLDAVPFSNQFVVEWSNVYGTIIEAKLMNAKTYLLVNFLSKPSLEFSETLFRVYLKQRPQSYHTARYLWNECYTREAVLDSYLTILRIELAERCIYVGMSYDCLNLFDRDSQIRFGSPSYCLMENTNSMTIKLGLNSTILPGHVGKLYQFLPNIADLDVSRPIPIDFFVTMQGIDLSPIGEVWGPTVIGPNEMAEFMFVGPSIKKLQFRWRIVPSMNVTTSQTNFQTLQGIFEPMLSVPAFFLRIGVNYTFELQVSNIFNKSSFFRHTLRVVPLFLPNVVIQYPSIAQDFSQVQVRAISSCHTYGCILQSQRMNSISSVVEEIRYPKTSQFFYANETLTFPSDSAQTNEYVIQNRGLFTVKWSTPGSIDLEQDGQSVLPRDFVRNGYPILVDGNASTVPPILWYKFDNVSGLFKDSSGSGINAILSHGIVFSARGIKGTNSAVFQSSLDSSMQIMIDLNLQRNDGYTVAAWMMFTIKSGRKSIAIDFEGESLNDRLLVGRYEDSEYLIFGLFQGNRSVLNITSFAGIDDQWHHYVLSVLPGSGGNNSVTLWIDGKEYFTSKTVPQYINILSGPPRIWFLGKSRWNDMSFDGQIDDLRLYLQPLTSPQVNLLFFGSLFHLRYFYSNQTNIVVSNIGNIRLPGSFVDQESLYASSSSRLATSLVVFNSFSANYAANSSMAVLSLTNQSESKFEFKITRAYSPSYLLLDGVIRLLPSDVHAIILIKKASGASAALVLNGSLSFDSQHVDYKVEWSCTEQSFKCLFVESPYSSAVLSVPASTLRVSTSYRFQLRLTTSDGRASSCVVEVYCDSNRNLHFYTGNRVNLSKAWDGIEGDVSLLLVDSQHPVLSLVKVGYFPEFHSISNLISFSNVKGNVALLNLPVIDGYQMQRYNPPGLVTALLFLDKSFTELRRGMCYVQEKSFYISNLTNAVSGISVDCSAFYSENIPLTYKFTAEFEGQRMSFLPTYEPSMVWYIFPSGNLQLTVSVRDSKGAVQTVNTDRITITGSDSVVDILKYSQIFLMDSWLVSQDYQSTLQYIYVASIHGLDSKSLTVILQSLRGVAATLIHSNSFDIAVLEALNLIIESQLTFTMNDLNFLVDVLKDVSYRSVLDGVITFKNADLVGNLASQLLQLSQKSAWNPYMQMSTINATIAFIQTCLSVFEYSDLLVNPSCAYSPRSTTCFRYPSHQSTSVVYVAPDQKSSITLLQEFDGFLVFNHVPHMQGLPGIVSGLLTISLLRGTAPSSCSMPPCYFELELPVDVSQQPRNVQDLFFAGTGAVCASWNRTNYEGNAWSNCNLISTNRKLTVWGEGTGLGTIKCMCRLEDGTYAALLNLSHA